MAAPSRVDPQRPLRLAILFARRWGIFFLGITALFLFMMLVFGGFRFEEYARVVIFLGLPGVAYSAFARLLEKRKFWALVAALLLTSLHCLFFLAVAIWIVIFTGPGGVTFEIAAGLIASVLGGLVYQLARSLRAIRSPLQARRGFEPILAQRVTQVDDTNSWTDVE
jgi:hypothetical protein